MYVHLQRRLLEMIADTEEEAKYKEILTMNEKIIEKIRALLEKTVENGASQEEAIAAATMAKRLMEKYKIDVSMIEQGFVIPGANMFAVWSELIFKLNQLRPLAADIGLLQGLFSLSNYETYFAYDNNIGRYCDEQIKSDLGKMCVKTDSIICYLRDSHPTCDGGILFTDKFVIDYPVEEERFSCIPYREITSVNYDSDTLTLETCKGTYDDFNLEGWNPENIGLFLQTVIGVKPFDQVEQAVLRGTVLDSLDGKSLYEYLQ